MPLHPHLEGIGEGAHGALGALDIAYRASAEPQVVDVRVRLSGPAELPLAPWAMSTFVTCINSGLAGGAEFAPSAGRAKLEAGPTGQGAVDASELGPDYAFRLEVAGVSPRFLRTMVEYLASAGRPHRLVGLSIVGGLPPDGSPLSARDVHVARWLDDPEGYVGAWSAPGFRVVSKSMPRGAAVRVRMRGDLTDEVAATLEETFSAWQSAVLTYPNARRKGRGLMDPHGSFARTRSDFFAKVSLFDVVRKPARDALVNALAAVHVRAAEIDEVEIGMA